MFNIKSFKDWKADYDSGLLKKKEEIEALLQKKYGKRFSVFSYISCTGVVYADKWGVVSEDNERFRVETEQGDDSYSDNYHSILLKQELIAKVKSCLEKEFDDYNFNIEINSKSQGKSNQQNDFILYAKVFVTLGKESKSVLYEKIQRTLLQASSNNTKIWSKWSYVDQSLKKYLICYLKNDGKVFTSEIMPNDYRDLKPTLCRPLLLDELEWLTSIVYLDELVENSRVGNGLSNLGEIVAYIKDFVFPLKSLNTQFPVEITKGQWIDILEKIINNPLVSSLKITKIIDVNELNHLEYPDIYIGHRAVNFADAEGNSYVIFRGTCGDLEWYDNAIGTMKSDTKQQLAAVSFLREIKADKRNPVKTLTAAGHSKGGNKAQYAFITTEEGFLDRCVSINGQGFSNEFLDKYKEQIKARERKLELHAERRDFVNCLCNWIGNTTFYSGWRGRSVPGLKYGYSLPFFHCSDSLYDWNGKFENYGKVGAIPAFINHFILFVLNEEKYSKIKETTVLEIISLMMIDRKTTNRQIAKAFFNLTMILCDLISNDQTFRQKTINIFKEEEMTLLATFEMLDPKGPDVPRLSGKERNQISLNQRTPVKKLPSTLVYYIEYIALRFFRDSLFRRNLLATLKFFSVSVMTSTGTGEKLVSDYIEEFIAGLIGGITKKSAYYNTDKPLNKRIYEIRNSYDEWRFSKLNQKSSTIKEKRRIFSQFLDYNENI